MKLLVLFILFCLNGLADTKKAVFAGGCFWCVEPPYYKLEGINKTTVGFAGGQIKNPSYSLVSSGKTRHVEAIEIEYDPKLISFKDLVYIFFKTMDPTDSAGQFVDRGSQYRPVIYYSNESEKKVIDAYITELKQSKVYKKDITIEVTPYSNFYAAEDYHQKYFIKNPLRYKYYRHRSGRDEFLENVWGKKFKEELKKKYKYLK